jgi:hypothetical protein
MLDGPAPDHDGAELRRIGALLETGKGRAHEERRAVVAPGET